MSGARLFAIASEIGRQCRARRWVLGVAAVLAWAAWCWGGVLGLSFTGECNTLIRSQEDRFVFDQGILFRPLVQLWFWCGARCFGMEDPGPWHAAELGLHLVDAALVAVLARCLGCSFVACCTAALLFAVGAGAADSLCWVAASNRPLAALGGLSCLIGLTRFQAGWRWRMLALLGLLLQLAANEEFYGTALFASAWIVGRARGARWSAVVPLALVPLHFFFLRGRATPHVGATIVDVAMQVPRNALTRLDAIATGWHDWVGPVVLVLALLGLLLPVRGRDWRVPVFVAGALLASFVPFVVESGAHYRDYPTLAPLALAVALLLDALLPMLARQPARWILAGVALVSAAAAGHPAREQAIAEWGAATAEFESCRVPLLQLAKSAPTRPPVLVNCEVGTRSLLYAFAGFDADRILTHPTLAFLDTPHACGLSQDVPASPGGLWGRRGDGSYGAIDAAQLETRPRVDEWRLYGRARAVGSLAQARELLASGEVDPREVAVVEAAMDALAAVDSRDLCANDRVRMVEPMGLDGQAMRVTVTLDVDCECPRLLVMQPAFLYGDTLRYGLEYVRLARFTDPRTARLDAEIDGAAVQVWHAQGFGFATLVGAGHHRAVLRFEIRPPQRRAS